MTNTTVQNDRLRMYKNINWAIRMNAQGNQTDLRGDYFSEMETLDDQDTWESIESFYVCLQSMNGWEYTHNKHADLIEKYPNITKFLTVCVYA